jgi:phosphate:Na+ symporter
MSYMPVLMGVLGGLSLFLYGVTRLSISLRKIAGPKMKSILERFTSNVFIAILSGIIVTVILDSSSVTIIMVIAIVNSKLISLERAIGVIMGANIGTTFSSQIVAFKLGEYSALLLVVGFLLYFLSKKRKNLKYIGLTLFGFGLIFFGLVVMGKSVEPLKDNPALVDWIKTLENPWKGALVGAALTALIQSSSATMGIVITLAGQKMISLAVGVTVMLGAEIGTCADTLIASIGRSAAAIKAGLFHLFFNVTTVLIGITLHEQITALSALITSENNIGRQIANAHLIFNIGGVLLFAWFVPTIVKLLHRMVPQKKKGTVLVA